jgi:para-aminobenzoate synthetase/4-amino-4-deoxychorismate lyase
VPIAKKSKSEGSSKSILVCLSRQCTQSNDLFLRHKTTHRQLYDQEYRQALAAGYDDAIFLNNEGNLTEGAIHNVFVVRKGQWLTPPVTDGLLPGVLRSSLIKERDCVERQLMLEDLVTADEVFLGNSVRGLQKVRRIDQLDGASVGSLWISETVR